MHQIQTTLGEFEHQAQHQCRPLQKAFHMNWCQVSLHINAAHREGLDLPACRWSPSLRRTNWTCSPLILWINKIQGGLDAEIIFENDIPKHQSLIPCASYTFSRSDYQAILEGEHWSIHIRQMTLELSSSEIFGFSAATLSTIAFLPQVLKTWRTQSAKDVSYALLLTFSTGCLCWVIYGYQVAAKPVMIANAFTLALNLIILAMKITFENNLKPASRQDQQ